MTFDMGTAQASVGETGMAVNLLPAFSIVSGETGSGYGLSATNESATSGTAGFFNNLVGAYEIISVSGPNGRYLTVDFLNEAGLSYTGYLNKTYQNYVNTLDIYTVTVHTTGQGGALFTTPNTKTFVGGWSPRGLNTDGIAFINDAPGITLNDMSMAFYVTGNQYSNAIAMQTDGGNIRARGCLFLNYPVAAHGFNGGSVNLGHCTISQSYYGVASDSNANALIEGSIISRCSIPVIAENAGSLKITHDLKEIGQSHIKGNRGTVCVINGNAEVSGTKILGVGGIYAENATLKINNFTTIDANSTIFGKGGIDVLTPSENNRFAIQGINSLIVTPDISASTTAFDPATKRTANKFSGVGDVAIINSKLTGSFTNAGANMLAGFKTLVDTAEQNPEASASIIRDASATKE